MNDYKERLSVAKKSYIATDGPGEAGTRLLWTLEQVGHSYTNMDVENLRVLFPEYMTQVTFLGKDRAYIIGHITQLFIVPTIILELAVRWRIKKGE
jgi:hypothetical protein